MTFALIIGSVRRALTATLVAATVHAAQADAEPFHWGYSATFGSGPYLLSGAREVDVYRASFKATVRDPPAAAGGPPGIIVPLPVAIGLNDTIAVTSPDRDKELKLATFLPGLAVELRPGERFSVRPSVQLGAGRELNAADGRRDSALLAAFGVRTQLRFPALPGQPALINGLLWAGFDAKERLGFALPRDANGTVGIGPDAEIGTAVDGERGSLFRLTSAIEFSVPTPRWQFREQTMYLQPHVLSDRYYRPPSGLSLGDADEPPPIDSEWQVGVAAGRDGGFQILFLKFDSVGVAYRFSDHNEGVRLYLNSVF